MNEKCKTNSDDEILRLDNQLCFALYVCSKEIIKKYKPLLDPLGLTYTGYIILLALWEQDNVTVKELGEKLYLDSGTLTPLLKKMEILDLLTRKRGLDERTVYINLTEKACNLKKEAYHIPKDLVCSVNCDLREGQQLLEYLHNLMRSLKYDDYSTSLE